MEATCENQISQMTEKECLVAASHAVETAVYSAAFLNDIFSQTTSFSFSEKGLMGMADILIGLEKQLEQADKLMGRVREISRLFAPSSNA